MRKSAIPIICQMKISPSVSLALFNYAWIYILNIVHKNSQGQVFASTVVILSISNMSVSYKINSFKDLSTWIINKEDADSSPLGSEKSWLSNGLCLIFALLWESRGLSWLLSFLCWVCGNTWRESLLQGPILSTRQRQYIFNMHVCINVCICMYVSVYLSVYVSICLLKCKAWNFAGIWVLSHQYRSSMWPNPSVFGINFNLFTSLLLQSW